MMGSHDLIWTGRIGNEFNAFNVTERGMSTKAQHVMRNLVLLLIGHYYSFFAKDSRRVLPLARFLKNGYIAVSKPHVTNTNPNRSPDSKTNHKHRNTLNQNFQLWFSTKCRKTYLETLDFLLTGNFLTPTRKGKLERGNYLSYFISLLGSAHTTRATCI